MSLSALIAALAVVLALILWPDLIAQLGLPGTGGRDSAPADPGGSEPGPHGRRTTAEAPGDGERSRVVSVVDGDTVKVTGTAGAPATVRILGIDCPESKPNQKCVRDGRAGRLGCAQQVPLGLEAKRRAEALLRGVDVRLECDGPCRKGGYGRALRYLRLANGEDFGLLMVREGLCWDFGGKYPHPRRQQYSETQARAQAQGLGLWGKGKPEPL